MKENIKTFLLVALFLISVFLSRHFWISDFNKTSKIGGEEVLELEADMVKPYKAQLNFNRRNHTVIYEGDGLWLESKDYLLEALSSKAVNINSIDLNEYNELLKKKSVVFYFPNRLNTYLLAKSLDIENTNHLSEKIPKIDSIYLSLFNDRQFIVIRNKDDYYKIDNFSLDVNNILEELKTIESNNKYTNYYPVKDSMDIDSSLYIAYNIEEKYPYIYIEEGSNKNYMDRAKNYSERFFKRDIDYIREVVEDNGYILHIYDQEVLKYGSDGSLEYFNPLQKSVKERNLSMSLRKASEFLKENIKNSGELSLSNLEKIEFKDNLGYRFIFRYDIKNLELLDIEGKDDHVYIDVYNNYVQSYRTHINTVFREEYPEGDVVSPFNILNEEYDLFKSDFIEYNDVEGMEEEDLSDKVFESFKDMSMFYITVGQDDERVLKPIWLFVNDNMEYMFDLYTGDLIYKRVIE